MNYNANGNVNIHLYNPIPLNYRFEFGFFSKASNTRACQTSLPIVRINYTNQFLNYGNRLNRLISNKLLFHDIRW